MRKCPRCSAPIHSRMQFCPACGRRLKGGHYSAPQKKTFWIVGFLVFFMVIGTAGLLFIFAGTRSVSSQDSQKLTQTNNGCVITKQHPVRMQDAAHGTAELEVSMPDYYQIFTEALAYDDPQGYVSTVLDSGNYPVVSRTATAQVTVQDGQEVVHTDEAIMALLDRELTNVIGEIMEEEP